MIEVRNLTVHFPVRRGFFKRTIGHIHALTQVSFSIFSGEILGICGESGSGKTTLGRCVAHLLEPDSGLILMEGHPVDLSRAKEKKKFVEAVQIVFQDPVSSLNPRKTIRKSLQEPLMYGPLELSFEESLTRAIECLQKVGLGPDVLERYPHQFSGGQQQRICIARALSFKPKLIVCDEILSALDLSIQAQIMQLLKKLRDETGVSLMFISHDLAVVRQLCDRVAVMYLGEIVEQGPTEKILLEPFHPYTQSLIASMPVGRKEDVSKETPFKLLTDEPPSAMKPPSGCKFHPRCYKAIASCSVEYPPYQTSDADSRSWRCIWNPLKRDNE
jgi:oligopeptide/dipeptide ABC transporter ATP-binding protein